MQLYRLIELEWQEKGMRGQPVTVYGTDTAFGGIDVEQNEKSKRWRYSWCFTEYYDEGKSDKTYKTADDAKAAAWKFYLGRILGKVVEEVGEAYEAENDRGGLEWYFTPVKGGGV